MSSRVYEPERPDTDWQKRIGMGTRERFGIWNGWPDTGPQSWATACTGHAAAKVVTTLPSSC